MMRLLSIIGFVLFLTSGYAFADGPWKGKILDIETKEALEGVVVLAVWDRIYRTPFGTSSYFYEAKETVTNKAGEFEIPAYTPINLLPIISYMQDPEFTIFKPGYGSLRMSLGDYLTSNTKKPREMLLSGVKYRLSPGVVELTKLNTKEERRVAKPAPIGDKNEWRKQKLLIKAIREEWGYIYNDDPGDLYLIKEELK